MNLPKSTNLDYEALVLFCTLHETHNLIQAAEKLGLSVATASRTLTRLRQTFGNTLFTRCGTGLSPNFYAYDLLPKVKVLIQNFDSLLKPTSFSPAQIVRTVRFACVDHAIFFIVPMIDQMLVQSPDIEIEIEEIDDRWAARLKTGEIDFAVSPTPNIPENFHSLELGHFGISLLLRRDHPLALKYSNLGVLTQADCLAYRYIDITYKPTEIYRQSLAISKKAGDLRRVAIRTPFFFSACLLLERSDLLLRTSSPFAATMAQRHTGLVAIPLPESHYMTGYSFTPRLIWHERSHTDPQMQWVRSMVASEASHSWTKKAAA